MIINRLYITATALVLTVVLAVVLLLPKYQSLQDLNSAIKGKESDLHSKQDYFTYLKEISQQLADYNQALLRVDSALPSDPSLPSLFDYFQKTTSQTGLLLDKINLGGIKPPEKNSKIKEIYVRLTLSGLYPDFKNFLSTIEKSARLIQVQKITFSTPKDPAEPFSFSVDIKTQSY